MWHSWLYRLKERLVHPNLKVVLAEMQRNDRLSRDELRDLQRHLIARTFQQAANCEFYDRIFKERELDISRPDALSQLPILTKENVQEHLEKLVDRSYRGRLRVAVTSGSTGTPGRFYRTRPAVDWGYASGVRCMQWWDLNPAARTMRIWGRSSQFNPSMQARARAGLRSLKDWAVGTYNVSAYNLAVDQVRRQWKSIIRWKPSVIHGYVTGVYLLAQFLQEAGLDGRFLGLNAVIVESEKLYPFQRSLIEETFGCPVLEWYGACEFGVIATPCPAGRLHIREDMVHVEIVDGLIIVTTLREHAMPLIRYDIGDEGEIDPEACPCGMPTTVLASVKGRTHDLIQRADGGFVHGEVFSHILEQLPDVRKFKVIQKTRDLVHIQVESRRPISPRDRNRVVAQVQQQLGREMTISLEQLEEIPVEKSGKFRWIVSELRSADRRAQTRK